MPGTVEVCVKKGDDALPGTLVSRTEDREKLVRGLEEHLNRQSDSCHSEDDNECKEPSDFEASATDWVPSDDTQSDSDLEVENNRRRISISKAACKKRRSGSKNVLTPSNKVNTSVRRCNIRKLPAPKQYISPPQAQEPFFIPLPITRVSPNGKVTHILPNSTRPVAPNNIKREPFNRKNTKNQVSPNGKKQISSNGKKRVSPNSKKQDLPDDKKKVSPYARIYKERKRTYCEAIDTNTPKQNNDMVTTTLKQNDAMEKCTPKQNHAKETNKLQQNVNKTLIKEQNATETYTPKQYARKIKNEENETNNTAENTNSKENLANNNNTPNTLNRDEPKNENIQREAENQRVKKHINLLNIEDPECDQVNKQTEVVNVIMNVKLYAKFKKSIRKMHTMYDSTLKVTPKNKQKEWGLKKLKKFYTAKRITIDEIPKEHIILDDTYSVSEEILGDMDVENENLDDFDRSDDNILISNKFANIDTANEPETKDKSQVCIGSGKTIIPIDKFNKIKWSTYAMATRGLLQAAFSRRVLATHSMTGKKSPAFLHKPAKMCLDPKKVADIIYEVTERYKIRESLVRSIITTKCADESKMFRMRMQKREREAKLAEQNTNNNAAIVP